MNQPLSQKIKNLKNALLSLPPTGETGFEGLIGATLREISGVPFRLAGSGSQFGIDGRSVYEEDAICFECKRYDDSVPRKEVFSKIAELSICDTQTDIWVLCATTLIKTQLADDARKLGAKDGIFVLILDWSSTDLPLLAVALAMGGIRVQEFLENYITDKQRLQNSLAALEAVRKSQDFDPLAERIRDQCNEPTVGNSLAKRANTDWLSDAFSSRERAKNKLGQPLTPGDWDTANVRQRNTLIDKLHSYLTTALDETVVCILGGEGHGKSWIVAQSWLALEHKPLMVFMNPDDFAETAGQNDVVDLLIAKLIKQTGNWVTETTREQWRRRLGQWRNNRTATDIPRLIVVIDGINQRPKSDWARIIGSVGDELGQFGGRLIVTARTPYFRDRVKGRLAVFVTEIDVPEWTEAERDEILLYHGIKTSELHHDVKTSLRNPRLLGIALELQNKSDVTNLEELSVSRLLFEHIRMSERDAPVPQPAREFASQLQIHAQQIISRVKEKQHDDLDIFEDDMGAVADGRFFQSVDGDPTRYSLRDDGLTLALGFSVIDRLRTATRNNRNLDAELEAILDPIAALDDTANVIMAALTVTVVDERYEQDIATSLVNGFVMLQNPDESKFLAFVGLAKKRPQVFMDAACVLTLAGGYQPNFDWIQSALIMAGRNNSVWSEMADEVHSWLSVCSLSPDRGAFAHLSRDPQEKVQEEREKNRKKIEEKLHALSPQERIILKNLHEEEGDLSRLSRLALLLLARKPLAPFAKSLLNWCFSHALNSDQTAPREDFIHLVRLNRIDWPQTRAALLEVSALIRGADVSTTGKWALVNILHATGHSDDGKDAESLVKELTKGRPTFEGWSLIEKYCATDPCDPSSEEPENITRTAEQYASIDVSKLRQVMGQTSEDLLLVMARPGIARFKAEVAIVKHREIAADILNRVGVPLRQGLFELQQHNALLTIKEARELVEKRHEVKNSGTADGLSEQDAWIISQYLLLLAFPFLSAHEQTEILLSDNADEKIMLVLMELAKPLSEKEIETLLGSACREKNEHKQYLLLALAKYTSVPLSRDTCIYVGALFRSESERVRTEALGVIAQSDDKELLGQFVESDWKATDVETKNSFEYWFGSVALLEAAVRGLMTHDEVLNRISARLYGRAATMLNENAVHEIARRIDASINHVIELDGDLVAPDIKIKVLPSTSYEPGLFSVSESPSKTRNIEEAMGQLSEVNEDFERHQRRNYDAFLAFKANLTQAKASIILDHLKLEEFATIVATAEEFADRWYALFMNIAETKLPAIHNFVLLLAHSLGRKTPGKAGELFRRVKDSKPLVHFTFGRSGIQLDAMAIWAGVRCPVLDDLRFARLDQMGTDQDLALEVLAALLNGHQELLAAYIETKLSKEDPAEISRGIMVAGFSDQSEFNDGILKRYKDSAGFIGTTQKAAKYAYEHNVWARYWFKKMCQTNQNSEFWRYAILFLKIVDGRFTAWHSDYTQKGSPFQLFGSSLDSNLQNRFAKWETHRNKKLFGSNAPESIFLGG